MLFAINFIIFDLVILKHIFIFTVDILKLSDILGFYWKLANVMNVVV